MSRASRALRAARDPLRVVRAPVLLATLALLAACGGPVGGTDAGRSDAALDGQESAHVSVELSVDAESLEDDTTLERLSVGVLEVHAPNDRGDLGAMVARGFELATAPTEIMLTSAAPAVYAGVEVDLGSGAWGSSLVLRLRESERTIEVTLTDPLTLEGRCDSPVALETGRELALRAQLDVAEIAHLLREASLPEPTDGVIHVDATSAPELIATLVATLGALRLDCDEHEADG